MGLMGPSWSWEEIQRKDSIMNDLKKENDRVLDKQRKENDRVMRKLDRNNSSSNASSSTRSDHSLSPDDYYHLNEYLAKEIKANSKRDSAILASKNRINNIKLFFHEISFETIGGWFVFLILAILFRKNLIMFILFLIILLSGLYYAVMDVIKYFFLPDDKDTKC